jgi:3-isopropylmalate/(R)-2-methylmalate dehydratase small subunit
MAAIELPKNKIDRIFSYLECSDAVIDVDIESQEIVVRGGGREENFKFDLLPFDKALVLAGGWVDYADRNY